jgi:hypothetical protein
MATIPTDASTNEGRTFYAHYIAIFILSFVFYGNSLKNEYSMDDNLVTSTYEVQHPTVEGGFAAIPEIFTSHFVVNAKQSYAYRPITTTSFAIEYQFFGQNPTASHFINILLYALAILILFRVLNQIWGEEKYVLSTLVCLIFLIHPIHTEVVNNIKSRDEILSFLFGISALKQALNYYDKKKILSLILTFVFILFSLLSKKTGMIFIAVLPLTLYYFRSVSLKRIGIVVGSLLIGFIMFKLMGKFLLTDSVARVKHYFENPLYFTGFGERVPMYFYSNYYYLALMIFPYPLRYYYGFDQVPIADWSNPMVYLMLVVMVASVGITIWRIKKKEIWGYAILFYFLAIGGACNLLFPAVGIIAERFAFIASLGFSILVGYGIYHFFYQKDAIWLKSQKIAQFSLIAIALISAVYVFNRNKVWKTDFSLYKNDIEHLEKSYKAHNMLGQSYYKQSLKLMKANQPPASYMAKVDSAEMEFKKCVALFTDYAVTYNNLGALNYTFKKQEDTAYHYFNLALSIDSNYIESLFNLGNIEVNRYYGYYHLYAFTSQLTDTVNAPSAEATIEAQSKHLFAIGKLLQDLNNNVPNIINGAQNNSSSQQDFLVNLQNNVVGYLTKVNAIQWFDQDEFTQKILANGQGIIQSYEEGYLSQHLYNFIGLNLTKSVLNDMSDLSGLNKTSIADWCSTNMGEYESLFLGHFNRCLDVNASYYPAFQSLNKYYYDLQDYDQVLTLNRKVINHAEYPYYYEFNNNIAKAHYFQNQLDSCKYYLELTIEELDLSFQEGNNATGNLTQYRQGVIDQLNHVNQLLSNSSN